jgi:tryptophanyl-tRNA synthetase
MAEAVKPVVFSGIQPTGKLHIGNYIGAITQWVENLDRFDNIFCIVDLHAITIPEVVRPEYLRAKTREVAALYVASGIDTDRAAVFVQSHISAHAELAWILNCLTPLGWMERMTQYKAKASRQESVGTGLLVYPALMAADILLYNTNYVPVGEDQRQHIELTRDVAERFNHMFGPVFTIPEAMIREGGERIMGLDDPTAKMSKSIGEEQAGHSIGLLDPPGAIRKAIMRAVTDSGSEVLFEKASPGVLNLLNIYQVLSRKSRQEVEANFEGKGYGTLKKETADLVIACLEPLQKRYAEITADQSYIEGILKEGADRIRPTAEATLARVKEQMGIG